MTTLYVRSRIHFASSGRVRSWFGCRGCGLYGDYTIGSTEEADAFLAAMDSKHQCPPPCCDGICDCGGCVQ